MRNLFFFLAFAFPLAGCFNAPEPKAGGDAKIPAPETPVSDVSEPAPPPEAPLAKADDEAQMPALPDTKAPAKKKLGSAPTKKTMPQPTKRIKPEEEPQQLEDVASIGMEAASIAPIAAPLPASPPLPLQHEAFEKLLQQYVSESGKVDYKGLRGKKNELDAYCQLLSDNPPQESWSRSQALAFWINAYNAFTLKLIVDNYPTRSIIKLDGGKPWDVRRIKIGPNKYSLNNIENDIIRPKFQEPRIHFAVNCAAQSCPPLWNHAYTADNLETALESRARSFINNSSFNTLSGNKARVSKIFDWYGADFGDLRTYLNRYAESPLESGASIRFNEYDWDLND